MEPPVGWPTRVRPASTTPWPGWPAWPLPKALRASERARRAGGGGVIAADPVLEVRELTVDFPTDEGVVHAVRGLSWSLEPGQVLGVVGESGSGKSVSALAVMGLLPATAEVGGSVRFKGRELLALPPAKSGTVHPWWAEPPRLAR